MKAVDVEGGAREEDTFLRASGSRSASPSRGARVVTSSKSAGGLEESKGFRALLLLFCFLGLQGSYLTWGFFQERIMTTPYSSGEKFPSSTFVVFSNRLLALIVASVIVFNPLRNGEGRQPMPSLLQFAPCSFSNVLSSWAQYECLKYISFPMQVVSKSCKVIPVMLVGKALHGKSYPWVEYIEAVGITIGVSMFSLSESKNKTGDSGTQFWGLILVAMYLACDSFTSQWQDRVFRKSKIDQYQMMLGVNSCSILFTGFELLRSNGFSQSLAFIMGNPEALPHLVILSITSATGQLFIFFTIKKFGPIIFTIIMTCRQMLSMVLSCIWYGHTLGWLSALGAVTVFGTLGHRIQRKSRDSGGRGRS